MKFFLGLDVIFKDCDCTFHLPGHERRNKLGGGLTGFQYGDFSFSFTPAKISSANQGLQQIGDNKEHQGRICPGMVNLK